MAGTDNKFKVLKPTVKCRQARHYTASGGQIRKTGVTEEKAAAYLVCAACLSENQSSPLGLALEWGETIINNQLIDMEGTRDLTCVDGWTAQQLQALTAQRQELEVTQSLPAA